jgi:hypothetical protein
MDSPKLPNWADAGRVVAKTATARKTLVEQFKNVTSLGHDSRGPLD